MFKNQNKVKFSFQILFIGLIFMVAIATFAQSDTDGDGVPDSSDSCVQQGNEGGLGVDETGCPYYDADWDGIYDRNDNCPWQADEYGYGVGSDGCPLTEEVVTETPTEVPTQDSTDIDNETQLPPSSNNPPRNEGESLGDNHDGNNETIEEPFVTEEPDNITHQRDWTRDADGDDLPDIQDVCPWQGNEGGLGVDETGCPYYDADWDGYYDRDDACPWRADEYGYGVGADGCPCDEDGCGDRDNDGVANEIDNCPNVANPDQIDLDSDDIGDACDTIIDYDGDNIPDEEDNCPSVANPEQTDSDEDEYGDACDNYAGDAPDTDEDGVIDDWDNCINVANIEQTDTDYDDIGDACDTSNDSDNDGIVDGLDNCPLISNPDQADDDFDAIGTVCDNTPYFDRDGDGIYDQDDSCPDTYDPGNTDTDGDSFGNVCDPTPNGDADRDGADDAIDNCLGVTNPSQDDMDGDGQGDLCDDDIDGDGFIWEEDNCPLWSNPDQSDRNNDNIGDACEEFVELPENNNSIEPDQTVQEIGVLPEFATQFSGLSINLATSSSTRTEGNFISNAVDWVWNRVIEPVIHFVPVPVWIPISIPILATVIVLRSRPVRTVIKRTTIVQGQQDTWVVRYGDTLNYIASFYDVVTASDIFNFNRDIIDDPNWIYPGEELRIPSWEEVEELRGSNTYQDISEYANIPATYETRRVEIENVPVIENPPRVQPVNYSNLRDRALNVVAGLESSDWGSLQTYDSGIVSFGRWQFTLSSGNLALVLDEYLANSNSNTAIQLAAYMSRVRSQDPALRNDEAFKNLLRQSANEIAMQNAQRTIIQREFWDTTTLNSVRDRGISTPLGVAFALDTAINAGVSHGYFSEAQAYFNLPTSRVDLAEHGISERDFIKKAVEFRARDLIAQAERDGLPGLRERANFWTNLVNQNDWQLATI